MLIVWLILVVTVAVGWILNIISLTGMEQPLQSAIGILRIVGIFIPPLGTVMGYFV